MSVAVVVGGGAVGLAVARALGGAGRQVLLLERAGSLGSGTSSRSSGVLHRGLHHPGQLRHSLCLQGRLLLLEYLGSRRVALNMCGKLVVAADEEEGRLLRAMHAAALAGGVSDLRLLSQSEAREREGQVSCHSALLSPHTGTRAPSSRVALSSRTIGVFDSHAYLQHLSADCDAAGVQTVLGCAVLSAAVQGGGRGFLVRTDQGDVRCDALVNAAGLDAALLARRIAPYPAALLPRCYFAKGSYFRLAGASPFGGLVYPVPQQGGLGVHCTVDTAGAARFGPDVQWLVGAPEATGDAALEHDSVPLDYAVDPARESAFRRAVARYWPGVRDRRLLPDYAGIRPKLAPPSGPGADFLVHGPRTHGVSGLVQLMGIESPGLTASLAIGALVERLLREDS